MAANGVNPARTRQQRVATVELPPGQWARMWAELRRGSVLVRLVLCLIAGILLWLITRGWAPAFEYHLGMVPERNILPRIEFQQIDEEATEEAREDARRLAKAVYIHDPHKLEELQAKLKNDINKVLGAESFEALDAAVWQAFTPQPPPPPAGGATANQPVTDAPPMPSPDEAFAAFKQAFAGEGALEKFSEQVKNAIEPFQLTGLITALPEEHNASFEDIVVRLQGVPTGSREVEVARVLIESAKLELKKRLEDRLEDRTLAERVFAWLSARLPSTLTLDKMATELAQQAAADAAEPLYKTYFPQPAPDNVLAEQGKPLSTIALQLLRAEHAEVLEQQSFFEKLKRSLATFGMYIALYTLCGYFIYFRMPQILTHLSSLSVLLSCVVITVSLAMLTSGELTGDKWWQAEMIPLLLFGTTVAIAYGPELALLLAAALTLIIVTSLGDGLTEALVLMATTSGAVLVLRRVRSRSKLLSVGLVAAVVAVLTTLGVGSLAGEPLLIVPEGSRLLMFDEGAASGLLIQAGKFALWAIIAGSLMTCLLPIVERVFRVQTDLSLIELGDPAHPLLQELVRRAPGTYNHSINVASLAEAAAEAIGARGLLVRVGAYFHDIGKMLKPGYFIENQPRGDNRHESLVPAMSTLVIIAHVKDGADLARQHRLPQIIIDFIQQHHGTTLVEYFYRRASQQQEAAPEGGQIDESSFRYPGPKPQTKEAGILMLADAVESASRVLVEPTPSRIESLVEEITMKRLLDGQFDECGLTLEEVHRVRQTLVKSLIAVYHGRVKYPEPAAAGPAFAAKAV
jgi:putative nucleotidyltransferase with HDIG domain